MAHKIGAIRDVIMTTCRGLSTSPTRNAKLDPYLFHLSKCHCRSFLSPYETEEPKYVDTAARVPEWTYVPVKQQQQCSAQRLHENVLLQRADGVLSRRQVHHRTCRIVNRISRPKYRPDEKVLCKPEKFQVTHESQHFYLSARLRSLQPARLAEYYQKDTSRQKLL